MNKIDITLHNKPSQKTLEAAFPGKGKELRDLIMGKVAPDYYETVVHLIARNWSHPNYTYMLMTAINEILEGHGIEVIRPREDKHPSYEYVNMGDTYLATILLRDDGKLIVSSWGDIVEKHMDWYD